MALLALLAWLVSWPTADQIPPIEIIDSYGIRSLPEAQVRQALDFHEGDQLSSDQFGKKVQAAERKLEALPGVKKAGTSWLMTIESQTSNHHGGRHVARVGPLQLPRAAKYSMQVMSAAFTPRMYSLAHHHSGVDAVYVIEGEACYETPTRAFKLRDGETLALPAGTPMRAVVTGSTLRYVLGVIVYDAAQPPTMRMEEGTGPKLIACK